MPFTLAHPAAVLPLRHISGLRTAPLIIGAMAPDLPYYVPARVNPPMVLATHTLLGSFTIDLPLGLAALVVVVALRRPLTVLLPRRAAWLCQHALEPFRRERREWLLAPLAILLGVWSHLVWDSFTHQDGWSVRRIPALSRTVTFGWYSGEVCHLLQYLSSAVGLAIMVVWYWRLKAPSGVHDGHAARRSSAGPALMLVAGAGLLIGGVQAMEYYYHSDGAVYRTLDVLLTHSLAWFGVLYLFAGAVVEIDHRAHTGAQHPDR